MREINQTIPSTHRSNTTIDIDLLKTQQRNLTGSEQAPAERHFTKTINGEPGINPPARTYYPRSYSADGPGGNYSGL
jgi:hypothetical protein